MQEKMGFLNKYALILLLMMNWILKKREVNNSTNENHFCKSLVVDNVVG